jgi:putative membrane protein
MNTPAVCDWPKKGIEQMGPENFWGSGMWIFPMIMMIIMLLVVFGIFGRGGFRPPWSKGDGRRHSESPGSETPLDILKKRYAKGEITKEEFDQMKKDL